MTVVRPLVLVLAAAAALGSGCGPKRVPPPARPAPALVVLLPDADTGKPGRARISNEFGPVDLASERQAAMATGDRRPVVRTMTETDVKRLFGGALAALPLPPRHFTLYFQFESDRLTDASRALVPEILKAVKARPAPEVTVVGHTDTMGSAQ